MGHLGFGTWSSCTFMTRCKLWIITMLLSTSTLLPASYIQLSPKRLNAGSTGWKLSSFKVMRLTLRRPWLKWLGARPSGIKIYRPKLVTSVNTSGGCSIWNSGRTVIPLGRAWSKVKPSNLRRVFVDRVCVGAGREPNASFLFGRPL